ncbi:adenylyltransferase/cytidyltransferase family protein [Klenkia terrae]|jgi:riboflavin kinase/FMN adenylyltransferase|uniref:FAD synthase n=1 Tax=Klenkia terrae TaxID=1052259 RepID=A0ABU8E872_9ACTN
MTSAHPEHPPAIHDADKSPANLWWGLNDIPADWGPCVVTVGVFDGVHTGHQQLLRTAAAHGDRLGLPVVLLTFDPHPARVAGPARDTSALTSPQRRADLAGESGIDRVLELAFDQDLAGETADSFARRVLDDGLHAMSIVVGEDFRFGSRGRGDVALLRALGPELGWTVTAAPLHPHAGVRCSSTRVRQALAAGDVLGAADMLGRPHRLEGNLLAAGGTAGSVLHPSDPTAAIPAPGLYRVGVTRAVAGPGPLLLVQVTDRDQVLVPLPTPRPGTAWSGPVGLDFLEPA